MKYGLLFANFGNYGDVHLLAELAHQAEEAGWSGVFLMDTLCFEDGPSCDPWIALAAMAMRTQRIALGLQVAALARRRPWNVVREAVTLDHLSGGRLILGVGAGTAFDPGFAVFGEEMDAAKRAAMLDESLEILPGLWSGKPFSFQGEHYHIDPITFLPPPVQTPGIPLWIGGMELGAGLIERAARFDGMVPFPAEGSYANLTPQKVHELKRLLDQQRTNSRPFDIVAGGPAFEAVHDQRARAQLQAYAEAGATWFMEFIWGVRDLESVRTSIQQGPPSLS